LRPWGKANAAMRIAARAAGTSAHDPEKWEPVFGLNHAQIN
jgi:hypothetical protein